MKTSLLILVPMRLCMSTIASLGLDSVPDRSSEVIGAPVAPPRPDADYLPAGPGLTSLVNSEILQDIATRATTALSLAPNDASGQLASWYPQLQTWTTQASSAATSKAHADIFGLIPTISAYFARDPAAGELSDSLVEVQKLMETAGQVIVDAISQSVQESGGIVSAGNLSKFVEVFATGKLAQGGQWATEAPPIDSAGILILNAASVLTQLKAGPWQLAKQFLGGETTAGEYFSRYLPAGDGLTVLKTSYATNQVALAAKFDELKNWVDEQEELANPEGN